MKERSHEHTSTLVDENGGVQFVTPKTPYAPLKAFFTLSTSSNSACTTSTPFAANAARDQHDNDAESPQILSHAFRFVRFRVTSDTANFESAITKKIFYDASTLLTRCSSDCNDWFRHLCRIRFEKPIQVGAGISKTMMYIYERRCFYISL